MRLHFLGTGTSTGVPVIGCACEVCRSGDPFDQRTRCSALVEVGGRTILIDTATEFRLQALRVGLTRLDAVLYTHAHADHIMGMDDLRSIFHLTGQPVRAHGSPETLTMIRRTFAYAFEPGTKGGGKPRLDLVPVDGPFAVEGVPVQPIAVSHGGMPVLGFRIGGLAYVTDCNEIPPASRALLGGLDVLVIDALRERPHPTHFSLDEALAIVDDLRPRRAYLTHLSHELSHARASSGLPAGIEVAYDGLCVESPDPPVGPR